jgi:hypothetical protein
MDAELVEKINVIRLSVTRRRLHSSQNVLRRQDVYFHFLFETTLFVDAPNPGRQIETFFFFLLHVMRSFTVPRATHTVIRRLRVALPSKNIYLSDLRTNRLRVARTLFFYRRPRQRVQLNLSLRCCGVVSLLRQITRSTLAFRVYSLIVPKKNEDQK